MHSSPCQTHVGNFSNLLDSGRPHPATVPGTGGGETEALTEPPLPLHTDRHLLPTQSPGIGGVKTTHTCRSSTFCDLRHLECYKLGTGGGGRQRNQRPLFPTPTESFSQWKDPHGSCPRRPQRPAPLGQGGARAGFEEGISGPRAHQ